MGTATIEKMSREDALRQRDALLEQSGATLDELRERAEDYLLTAEEATLLRRIEGLTWLLGE
ncbi:hypothetical protein [Kribbia dieselivorans]|uniref:hypothetical protein n=1 Tax=Kribbia dieselivorans TaxID=331526 RepID=UPI0012EDEEC6|nr:hypothetical protein [Kribbia dieselivorans]